MQHTLIGLALVLIVAIVAALAAPVFVDWNAWRAEFEARASGLVGARVTIRGPISAMLLPTPAFVFTDVAIGDRERASGLTAAEVRGVLSLGALVRGSFEAEEVVLSRPVARLVIERDGRLVLPAGAGGGLDTFSISRISIERGALAVENRAGGFLAIDDLSAAGEMRSRAGPLRLDGQFMHNGLRFGLRASAGRFGADGSGRLRVALERAEDGAQFEAEGTLALANATPRFEGKTTLAQRHGLPWRLSAAARAGADEVVLSELALAFGPEEREIGLSGEARLAPRPGGKLTATLRATRLDLDHAASAEAPRKPWVALAPLFDALALGDGLPFVGRAEVVIDSIAAGGGLLRDLRAELVLKDGALAAERIEARLPGRGFVRVRGAIKSAAFTGDVALEAEEPAAFVRWIAGSGKAIAVDDAGGLRFTGAVNASSNGFFIERLVGELGPTRFAGRVRTSATKPERLEFELEVAQADGLAPVVETFTGAGDAGALLRRIAAFAPVLQLSGAIVTEPRGFAADATARADAMQANLRARFDADGALIDETRVVVVARDGARLLALIGIPPGRISGEAKLDATLSKAKDGAFALRGRLAVSGMTLAGEGTLRIATDGRIEPALNLTLDAADVRALGPAFNRAAGDRLLPGSGTAKLTRQSQGIALDDLALRLGETRVAGRLEFTALDPLAFAGKLTIDRTELATLLGLALGRASGAGFWPDAPLSPAALGGANGAVDLQIATLPLAGALVATNAEFRLKIAATEAVISGFAADLAGGKLAGQARVTRDDTLVFDARMALTKADATRLVVSNSASPPLRGRADLTLILSGQGRTPAALAANLAGQGVLLVDAPEIEGLDPGALAAVLAASGPLDEAKIAALLAEAFARGPLKLERLEAPLVVASGVARAARIRAAAGPAQVSVEVSVDLTRLNLDAAIELEGPPPAGMSAKPAATVRWRGPLAAPERRIEAAALATVLTLRTMERATTEAGVPVIVAPVAPEPAPVAPPPSRMPVPPKKPAPETIAVPPLPPPVEVRPVPGARRTEPRLPAPVREERFPQ